MLFVYSIHFYLCLIFYISFEIAAAASCLTLESQEVLDAKMSVKEIIANHMPRLQSQRLSSSSCLLWANIYWMDRLGPTFVYLSGQHDNYFVFWTSQFTHEKDEFKLAALDLDWYITTNSHACNYTNFSCRKLETTHWLLIQWEKKLRTICRFEK